MSFPREAASLQSFSGEELLHCVNEIKDPNESKRMVAFFIDELC